MKRGKHKKAFDCVALKRRAQAKIYADTKGMSIPEQIAYFRGRAQSGALGAWWRRVSRAAGAGKHAAMTETLTVRESPPRYSAKRKPR